MGRRTQLSPHREAELERAIREAWASERVHTARQVEEAIRGRWYNLWLVWSDSTLEGAREAYIDARRPKEKRSDRTHAAPYVGLAHLLERADNDARSETLRERAEAAELARAKAVEWAKGERMVRVVTNLARDEHDNRRSQLLRVRILFVSLTVALAVALFFAPILLFYPAPTPPIFMQVIFIALVVSAVMSVMSFFAVGQGSASLRYSTRRDPVVTEPPAL